VSALTVTVNDEDAAFYRRVARRESVSVAPVSGMGLDVARLTAALRSPVRLADNPSVVIAGRLTPDKNLDLAVSAFTRFRSRHPSATLTFVGDTMPGEAAWAVPRAPGIAVHPWVRDPFPLMAGANLIVSSSRREGLALVVAEALALGVPVAAVSNRGIRQIRRRGVTALVSCGSDAEALATAMERALRLRPTEHERGHLAAEWSRENAVSFHREAVYRALKMTRPRPHCMEDAR
jgi:glycosyltransferase involved in cell wall biosynthesis